jgi:hypothetical protein
MIIPSGSLEGLYKQTMEYLHREYYNHPSYLVHIEQTPEELAEQSYWDAVGRGAVVEVQASSPDARYNAARKKILSWR